MKKIIISFFALLIFALPLQQTYLQADAAILSKAASKAAQKIASEYIKDIAINTAINKVADTAKHIKEPSRMQKEGYMLICMDYTYKPGDKCAKPSNIKANLTDVDKANIGKQANVEMDKLITPNGKGFPKWAKFLDWFAPIWLVSMGVGALTYALNDDVASLFDEAAYNTLVALGIMAPVDTDTVIPPSKPNDEDTKTAPEGQTVTNGDITMKTETWPGNNGINSIINTSAPIEKTNLYTSVAYASGITPSYRSGEGTVNINGKPYITFDVYNLLVKMPLTTQSGIEMTMLLNGDVIETIPARLTSTDMRFEFKSQFDTSIITRQMESVLTRMPYKIGDFYYTDVLYNSVDGNQITYQLKSSSLLSNHPTEINSYSFSTSFNNYTNRTIHTAVMRNQNRVLQIFPPVYEDVTADFNSNENSSYKDDKGNIALLPPAAFTYQEESTGEIVHRVPNGNGEGYTWQKPDGTQVPEENVIPKPEEEPKITPAPDGTPQYTPAPTPSNPSPEPVPLKPDPNAPPANPPPGTEPPPGTIPDAPSCAVSLKMPIFSPLKEQLSTSFPFSIPWDIERAAHAAFDGVGNEKPSFDMVIPVGEKMFEAKIETPAFLDKWKPFMDGFLLLTFDLLLMFGLYRFVKGAGS